MSTFHAVVWMDHSEAHVVMFDREHMEAQRIRSRSHHKHQGKTADNGSFFGDIARALSGTHEVLLAGPGIARNQFRDAQLVAMARQYFKKFDAMAADPSMA